MKKSLLRFVFLILIFGVFIIPSATAQKIDEADIYYFNVPILKVFVHNKGYYVIYRRADLKTEEAFIPHKWFLPSDGRAQLQKINDRINPYLAVYVKAGKFDFTKLVLPKNPKNPVWGILNNASQYDDSFNNEALELKF